MKIGFPVVIVLLAVLATSACKRRSSDATVQSTAQTELNLFIDYEGERFSVSQVGESCTALCSGMGLISMSYPSQQRQYCINLRDIYVQNNAGMYLRASRLGGEGDANTAGAPCSLYSSDYSKEVEYLFARKAEQFNHGYKNERVRVVCLCK